MKWCVPTFLDYKRMCEHNQQGKLEAHRSDTMAPFRSAHTCALDIRSTVGDSHELPQPPPPPICRIVGDLERWWRSVLGCTEASHCRLLDHQAEKGCAHPFHSQPLPGAPWWPREAIGSWPHWTGRSNAALIASGVGSEPKYYGTSQLRFLEFTIHQWHPSTANTRGGLCIGFALKLDIGNMFITDTLVGKVKSFPILIDCCNKSGP